jgi:hypothetical protein
MVKEIYSDDAERRKYLNLRTKADLLQMIEERLNNHHDAYVPRVPSVPIPRYNQYTPPSTPTNEQTIQEKYGSFLERKKNHHHPPPPPILRKPSSHVGGGLTEGCHKPSPLPCDDTHNTNGAGRFQE